MTYAFKNGTLVIDYEKGNIIHPDNVEVEVEKDLNDTTNSTGSGFNYSGSDSSTYIEPEKPKPLSMKIDKIDREGNIKLEFNQDIKIPSWFGEAAEGKRLLGEKLSVNDVFSITFATNSDVGGS